MSFFEKIDSALFVFLNSLHHQVLDPFMYFLSYKYTWIPLYALLLYFLIKQHKKETIYIALIAIALIVFTDQVSVLIKNLVERYRPCHNLEIGDKVHLLNNYCGGQFGFISSHAANTMALATYLGFHLKPVWKKFPGVLLLWALAVAYSRIYAGVHYPFDVFAGLLFGWFSALIFQQIYIYFRYYKVNKVEE